jgi:NADH-quinone oxidoreductase subunit J
MLDINFIELRYGFLQYLPIGAVVGLILFAELVLVFGSWVVAPEARNSLAAPTPELGSVSNTHALGQLIYTDYAYLFQTAGLILLVAMIGAIVLTLRHRDGVHRQKISNQVGRRRDASIEIVKVPSGSGI